MKLNSTRAIALMAVMTSMVTVASYIGIQMPFSTGGYLHLGTLVALVIAMRYGKYIGAITGSLGMTIFDLLSGGVYVAWAPGTFVVRLIMGYVVGHITFDKKTQTQGTNMILNIISLFAGLIIMLVGYYLYESIFITDFRTALASSIGNIFQFVLGAFSLYLVPRIIAYDELQKQ